MTAEPATDVLLLGFFFVVIIMSGFIFGLRAGLSTIIFIRPMCDRLFDSGRLDIAGHALSYGAIINAVVICVFVLNIRRIWESVPSQLRNMWLPFMLVALLSITYSPNTVDAIRKMLTYISFFVIFMFPFALIRSDSDVFRFLKIVIASSILPVAYGLFQVISGIDTFYDDRIQSTFSHPNTFAFYIVTIVGAILFVLASHIRIGRQSRLILTVYLMPLLLLLIMTKTRSAWIASFLLFVAYGLVADRRVFILVAASPILALVVPPIRDRIADLATGNEYSGWVTQLNSYAWRELLWERALSYVWQNPIFGYGLDSFHFYSQIFFPLEPGGTHAHNIYIQVLFETGIIGLLAFAWLFLREFTWLIRYSRFDVRGVRMAAALTGVYIVAGYSDNLWEYLSVNWCFWFTIGAILWRIARSPSRAGNIVRQELPGGRLRTARTAGIAAGATQQSPS